jgi:sugar lactone lactonase YvrE
MPKSNRFLIWTILVIFTLAALTTTALALQVHRPEASAAPPADLVATQALPFGVWATLNISNSGLASNYVYAVAIDPVTGDRWFGTDAGASRLAADNRAWATYTAGAQGPVTNTIQSIAFQPNGVGWFGTPAGLSSFDGITWTTYTTATGLCNNNVHAIAVDQRGWVWVGTDTGVSRFDGANWQCYSNSPGNFILPGNRVHAIAVDPTGSLWFGTSRGFSKTFNGSSWTVYPAGEVCGWVPPGTLPEGWGPRVNALAAETGTVWLAVWPMELDWNNPPPHAFGVARFDVASQCVTARFLPPSAGLRSNIVNAIAIDAAQRKWLATQDCRIYDPQTGRYSNPVPGGVSVFDGSSWLNYTTTSGLASSIVNAIAIDAPYAEWFGTQPSSLGSPPGGGVSVLEHQVRAVIPVATGGWLDTLDGKITLDFPPDVVSNTLVVTLTHLPPQLIGNLAGVRFFDLTAAISETGQPVISLEQPVTITVRYTPQELSGAIESTLGLYWYNGTAWVQDGLTTVGRASGVLTSTTTHFTSFAVLGQTHRLYLLPLFHNYQYPSATPPYVSDPWIEGTLELVDIEGGCWVVAAAQGVDYQIYGSLAEKIKRPENMGRKIRISGQLKTTMVSYCVAGPIFEVSAYEFL